MKNRTKHTLWKVITLLLITLSLIQGLILIYLYNNNNKPTPTIIQDEITLKARSSSNESHKNKTNNTNAPSGLMPQAIPKINFNQTPQQPLLKQVALKTPGQPFQITTQQQSQINLRNNTAIRKTLHSQINIQEKIKEIQKIMQQLSQSRNNIKIRNNPHSRIRHGNTLPINSLNPKLTRDKNNFIVTLNISGLDKSNIKANVNNNILTISGIQKKERKTQSKYGSSYSSSSRHFRNSFSFPKPIKSEKLKLNYKNNILTIIIPKA